MRGSRSKLRPKSARPSGVRATNVLHPKSGSGGSAAAREKVEAAARALDYRKSTADKRPEAACDNALALIISDLTNPYYSMLPGGGVPSRKPL